MLELSEMIIQQPRADDWELAGQDLSIVEIRQPMHCPLLE